MKVTFCAADPRHRARPDLDQLIAGGTDQVAIACAFLTGGGVKILERHAARLSRADSFVVVAWEPPTTDFAKDLESLGRKIPGNLYLHLGCRTPEEKKVGRALMHSKVFFVRAGDQCRLWVGSHNLTASACEGVNCEAAVLLEGTSSEGVFQEALAHLNRCKQESVLFDPFDLPPAPASGSTLIVHAECDLPIMTLPWHVHLGLSTTECDAKMRPPSPVWLYLYDPGSLRPGAVRPLPRAAYSGAVTALSFTERHPARGIPADWRDADYVITEASGVLKIVVPGPIQNVLTQCVMRFEKQEDAGAVWVNTDPAPRLELIPGESWATSVDEDLRGFFSARSIRNGSLVHQRYQAIKPTFHLRRHEVGSTSEREVSSRLLHSGNALVRIKDDADSAS